MLGEEQVLCYTGTDGDGLTVPNDSPTVSTSEARTTLVQSLAGVGDGSEDWRRSIADSLRDPSKKVDKSIQQLAFRFVLVNDELYHCTAEDFLLK